ncbi:MAG: aminodeoxychorismate lyase [Arenimonas sp.]
MPVLSPADRGLAYGDGLFETLLALDGDMPWWHAHWRRLSAGAARLGIAPPGEAFLRSAAEEMLGQGRQVLKLILTRGESGRGYLPGDGPPTSILSVHPAPVDADAPRALHWCETPVARQPALAGLKHLNRLENVLARAECARAGHAEGLMCDEQGYVRCATAANVFALIDGVWHTPDTALGGVAGVARAQLLALAPDIRVAELSRAMLENADTVFLSNAVRGMMAVDRIGETAFAASAAFETLRQRFLAAHPAFARD